MKTRVLILFLTLSSLLPMTAGAQINYAISGNTGYVTSSFNAAGNLAIASSYNGYPVTSINNSAFNGCLGLKSVTIPVSVTNIGSLAFSGAGLTTSTIPDSVQNIGAGAFYECYSLTNALIGNGVTSIGSQGFQSCTGLRSVTIGSSVNNIGNSGFFNCQNLTNISIPNSVTSIGYDVFNSCTSLRNVSIGSGVSYIDLTAFEGCSYLTNIGVVSANPTYSSLNGVVFNKGQSTLYLCPQGYTGIYAIPNSVTGIGPLAFGGCYKMISFTIPNSVTNIGVNAFYECTSLTNITVAASNLAYSSTNGVLFDKKQATIIQYAIGLTNTSYAIPEGVASIGYAAFTFCNNLTNIIIPGSVTSIGDYAFYYCTKLTSVIIPSSVTNIGNYAFINCASLTNITFLGNAPILGNNVFNGVTGNGYYYYGTTGWGTSYGSLPIVLLGAPAPHISGTGLNMGPHGFGFTIAGVTNQSVVVDASADLITWWPVWTNTLSGTSTNFTDQQWTNYPARYYRAR